MIRLIPPPHSPQGCAFPLPLEIKLTAEMKVCLNSKGKAELGAIRLLYASLFLGTNLSPLSIFPPLAVGRTALVERPSGKGGDAPDFAVVVVIIEQTVVQVVRGVGLGDVPLSVI